MLRTLVTVIAVVLAASSFGCRCAGCYRAGCCSPPHGPARNCDFDPGPDQTEPPPLAALVSLDSVSRPGDGSGGLLPGPIVAYDALDAPACQCRSAAASAVAAAVELERHFAGVLLQCETDKVDDNLCLNRDLLALRAAGARNTAAGQALEAFYQLAGLEARSHYLKLARDEADTTVVRLEALRERGLPAPRALELGAARARLAELSDTLVLLDQSRIQLNGRLKKQLGCPLDESRIFRPAVDWTPDLAPPLADEQVAIGLAARADVRSLRVVYCNLQQHTLPVARAVVAFADASLGRVQPIHKLRCHECGEQELPIRRRQLRVLIEEAEQLATAEIKGAVYDLVANQRRVVLAARALEDQRQELQRTEKLRDEEDRSVFELSAARGRVYEAEAALIERVVDLKLAFVRLKTRQDLLAAECGYAAVTCLEGRCCTACGGEGRCCVR